MSLVLTHHLKVGMTRAVTLSSSTSTDRLPALIRPGPGNKTKRKPNKTKTYIHFLWSCLRPLRLPLSDVTISTELMILSYNFSRKTGCGPQYHRGGSLNCTQKSCMTFLSTEQRQPIYHLHRLCAQAHRL